MAIKLNLHYLAGYLDGDGCFYIRRSKSRNKEPDNYSGVVIVVTRRDPAILLLLKERFGGNIHNDKLRTQWTLSSNQSYILCKLVYRLLKLKRNQAKCIIELQELKTGKHRTKNILIKQKRLFQKIKSLKV